MIERMLLLAFFDVQNKFATGTVSFDYGRMYFFMVVIRPSNKIFFHETGYEDSKLLIFMLQ